MTTDTTLTSIDPVVFDPAVQPGDTPCTGTALVLGDAITLDCTGLTLKGNGSGFGIRVARGVEGATILNCVVDGFRTGIELGGLGSHIVDTTVVSNNNANGTVVASDFNTLTGVVSQKNSGAGFQITGSGNAVDGSIALENGKAGFSIAGKENFFDSNSAIGNRAGGFVGSGRSISFSSNTAISNAGDGLKFKGGSGNEPNDFSENKAITNRGNGILVLGNNPDANFDSGGNKGLANAGAMQCQITGLPCQ